MSISQNSVSKEELLVALSSAGEASQEWANASSQQERMVADAKHRKAMEEQGVQSVHPTERERLYAAINTMGNKDNVLPVVQRERNLYYTMFSRHGRAGKGLVHQPELRGESFTQSQQCALRNYCVAIAGAGGVGGFHIEAMTRLGVGSLCIADPDEFDYHNISRQRGATAETVGHNKAEVLADVAKSINPYMYVRAWNEGVTDANRTEFLESADAYIDGIDIFAPEVRFALFQEAYNQGIPVCTFAPVGRGTASIIFHPSSPKSPLEHMGIEEGMKTSDKFAAFLAYLSPALIPPYAKYLNVEDIDPKTKFAPALGASCMMAGSFAGFTIEQLAQGEHDGATNPTVLHFDWKTGKVLKKRIRRGVHWLKTRFLGKTMDKLGWRTALDTPTP